MNIRKTVILLSTLFIYTPVISATPDWSKDASLPGQPECEMIHGHKVCLTKENRKNIFNLPPAELEKALDLGSKQVVNWPVEITQLTLPKSAMDKFFESDSRSPIRRLVFNVAKKLSNFESFQDLFKWLGLHDYPSSANEVGPNAIPSMGHQEKYPMGVTQFHSNGYTRMTFSCAACHASDLFGVKVLGLTNRFPRANEAFILGKKALKMTPSWTFKLVVGPSDEDYKTFKKAKKAIKYVGVKEPKALGLDTSLAQVGLSLALRGQDQYATKIPGRRARKNPLEDVPADSKPAVWWNLKYKTRWLSDGSIVSGNPVHTNFLWNEIGRGVDLKELESWLVNNKTKVRDLTAYVFNTEAPKFNEFFPNRINIEKAKRGEQLFLNTCKGCHGRYEKGWSNANVEDLSYEEKIATTNVWYHKKTPVIDIKTDEFRADGMNYFAKDLNRLKISKTIGTVVTPQKGYVPPPLVGIWARWPYFHNNSAPTLYDVITPDFNRTQFYIAVPADDKVADFDFEKNGYPEPEKVRLPYKNDKEYYFNTKVKGLSNKGHTRMLVDDNGNEKFTREQKLELIEFLKTL